MDVFYKKALKMSDQIISWRREFHSEPELGFEEYKTSQKIKCFLEKEEIEYKEYAKTGICGIIYGASQGKTIALRSDMDALPIQDKKNCEYSSKVQGIMHACGHDAHMAILMGTAKILNSCKNEFNGNVKLIFEPAEETFGGSKIMIEEGILEEPHVDSIIGLHVDEKIQAGKIGIKKDAAFAASNPFTIKIIGRGGHGAHPDTAIDPVLIASNVIVALQSIVSREIPPTDAALITVGTIHGGTAQNIIPEEVLLSGIIRTLKLEQRKYVIERFKQIVNGIVLSMRGQCEIIIEESYPCLYNNNLLVERVIKLAGEAIGSDKVEILENPSLGVESFAYFSNERPSVFYLLGCGNKEKGIDNPAHGSFFDIDETCLSLGVALQCKIAVDLLLYNY